MGSNKQTTIRVPPSSDPAETIERLISRRQLMIEDGDVVVRRETLPRMGTLTPGWQYRVHVHGQPDRSRIFARYHQAIGAADELASKRRTRLISVEYGTSTLLQDYKPALAERVKPVGPRKAVRAGRKGAPTRNGRP